MPSFEANSSNGRRYNFAQGTRYYNFSASTRTAFGISSTLVALGGLGPDREVMLRASENCTIKFGLSNVTVAATDADALPLSAGERFHLRIAEDVTHLAVIRDTSNGFLSVTPVA